MKFKNIKTIQSNKKFNSFQKLSSVLEKMQEINKEDYYYLLGRIQEAKTDFFEWKKKTYTISSGGNPKYQLWEVNRNLI